MQYVSTRGAEPSVTFSDAILSGLTSDGGLLLPEHYPAIKVDGLGPFETAAKVMAAYTNGNFSERELLGITKKSWSYFPDRDPAPLRQLDENLWLLELFHGPTLAFKDYGLQFLATLFEKIGEPLTVIGATSGDTGAAAVHALAGKKNVKLFLLHPEGRISDVQRRQMTTIEAGNIFNIAIDGTFDDCQSLLKGVLADSEMQNGHRLTTINSINWGRVLAQCVYYWWAAGKFNSPTHFVVPSGNFGNAFSGYVAKKSGAPIEGITIVTNRNNILPRTFETGIYKPGRAQETLSPAMDIQQANNFERLMFEETGRDVKLVSYLFESLKQNGEYEVPPGILEKAKTFFNAISVTEEETLDAIKRAYKAYNTIFDPHTAVGYAAWLKTDKRANVPVVLLATAHPAKFPAAINHAIGIIPSLPARLSCLMDQKEHLIRLGADIGALRTFIKKEAL